MTDIEKIKICEYFVMNSIGGEVKIMTDQDLWESKQFHDDNIDNYYTIRNDIKLLQDKIAKLDEKINNLREELKSKVTLGNNETSLQPNGEIK